MSLLGTSFGEIQEAGKQSEEGGREYALYQQYLKEMYEQEMVDEAEAAGTDFVLEESHPDLMSPRGMATRAVFKNFSPNTETGFNYLQKQFPDHDWKTDDETGDVIVKRKNERAWRKLDPSDLEFQDITDIGYDVASGVGETAASALGGIGGGLLGVAGGPAGVGAGALGGAVAAGAGAGAAFESGRQGLGNLLGMEGYDTDRLKESAMWGAASPLLFGSGATAKHAGKAATGWLGKKFLKDQMKDPMQSARTIEKLYKAQSGIPMKSMRKTGEILPWAGSVLSGIDKDVLKWTSKNLDKIAASEKDVHGKATLIEELKDTLVGQYQREKERVGAQIGEALTAKGLTGISIKSAHTPFDKMIEKYERIYKKTPTKENRMDLEFAKKIKDDLFSKDTGSDVVELGEDTFGEWFKTNVNKLDKFLWGKGGKKEKDVIEFIDKSNAEGGMALVSKLNDYTGIRKVKGYAGTDTALQRLSSVERDARNAARQAAGEITNSINQALGDKYVGLKRQYQKMIRVGDVIGEYFKTTKKAESTLNSFFSPKKSVARKHILEASDILGRDVGEKAKEIAATGIFARADEDVGQWSLQTAARKAPASAIGAGLGYWAATEADLTKGAAIPIGAASGVLANRLVSPSAMRTYMSAGNKISKPWNMMMSVPAYPGGTAIAPTGFNIWEQTQRDRKY